MSSPPSLARTALGFFFFCRKCDVMKSRLKGSKGVLTLWPAKRKNYVRQVAGSEGKLSSWSDRRSQDRSKWTTYISLFCQSFYLFTAVLVLFLWRWALYSPSFSSVCGRWLPPLHQKGRFRQVIKLKIRHREHNMKGKTR